MMKFSIVSLNWNGKRYLGELLDRHMKSLLNINYDNFEIIFVDNGSTDGSADYIKTRYHDARLKVIRLRRNLKLLPLILIGPEFKIALERMHKLFKYAVCSLSFLA